MVAARLFLFVSIVLVLTPVSRTATGGDMPMRLAALSGTPAEQPADREPSPEEKMKARFPQPVKVGDLIGLPVLDGADRTLGFVKDVVRTAEGKIELIVPYGSWFGWARSVGPFERFRRLVAVPIEVVVILGRQIDAVDMDRPEFDKATVWSDSGTSISRAETIRIALGRR